MKRWHL